jgi:hypothetical protein
MASKIHWPKRAKMQFNRKGLIAIRLAFARKFGRFPRGDDPVFFDPDADKPHSLPSTAAQRLLLQAMLETNTPPQIVYAYCRTGFVVSGKHRDALPQERLSQWDTAILEYFAFGDRARRARH